MTEHYWQRYRQQISADPMNSDDQFWKNVRTDIQRMNQPKHHLELYSMCKSDNPFIRQVRNSPNITIDTVAQLICRDKACELQYCLSLQKVATENRRNLIDLKGCKEQYETMTSCLQVEKRRIEAKQLELRNMVMGLPSQVEKPQPVVVEKPKEIVYI